MGETIAIAARDDNTFAIDGGAVHLFSPDGTFLRTIGSPNAQEEGKFGERVNAVGSDRLLVSARREDDRAGNAYLFDLDGNLLETLSPPTPTEGAVFKCDLDGNLVTTFVSPRPGSDICFGTRATFVGNSHVLIADSCDRGPNGNVIGTGAAFLFDLDGTFVQTFDNPRPMTFFVQRKLRY